MTCKLTCPNCIMQAQHTQALQGQLEQLSAEVAAQRLALAAAVSERDSARASAVETSERLRVSPYLSIGHTSVPKRYSSSCLKVCDQKGKW